MRTVYTVCMRVRDRHGPPGVRSAAFFTSVRTGDLRRLGPKGCEKSRTRNRLCCESSASCKVNTPEFGSPLGKQARLRLSRRGHATLRRLASFVLSCLTSASASYLKSSAAFLQTSSRQERSQTVHFIISDHDTAYLARFTTLSCMCERWRETKRETG